MAGWPRGALLGTAGDRRHDGRDDDRAPGRARSGSVREGAGCDRPALGRQARRRRRSGLFRAGLSGGRDRMGGAVAQVRGGRPSASGAPATSERTVRGSVLLDGGDASAPRPNPARRTTHLDGELGVGRRLATRGAPRRRVAGLRLQHDAGSTSARPSNACTGICDERGSTRRGSPTRSRRCSCYLTEDAAAADAVLTEVLAPTLGRPPEQLRERLLVGSASECVDRLARFESAGAERVLIWPVGDELHQLETVPRHRHVPARRWMSS